MTRPLVLDTSLDNSVELIRNTDGKLNDSTYPSEEDGESSDGSPIDARELSDVESGEKRRRRRSTSRRERRRIDREEEEAGTRRRRSIILVVSAFPFLVAAVSLVLVMTASSRNASSPDDDGGGGAYVMTGDAMEVESADATTTTTATTLFESDIPTYLPTASVPASPAPSSSPTPEEEAIAFADTPAPSPPPTSGTATTESPSKFPSRSPVVDVGTIESGDYLADLVMFATASPTSGYPSGWPSTAPPTASPAEYCATAGAACPDKKESHTCCSGKCEKDKSSGEKVCAAQEEEEEEESANDEREEDAMTQCALKGEACPKDEKECCSGRCSGGKDGKTCS